MYLFLIFDFPDPSIPIPRTEIDSALCIFVWEYLIPYLSVSQASSLHANTETESIFTFKASHWTFKSFHFLTDITFVVRLYAYFRWSPSSSRPRPSRSQVGTYLCHPSPEWLKLTKHLRTALLYEGHNPRDVTHYVRGPLATLCRGRRCSEIPRIAFHKYTVRYMVDLTEINHEVVMKVQFSFVQVSEKYSMKYCIGVFSRDVLKFGWFYFKIFQWKCTECGILDGFKWELPLERSWMKNRKRGDIGEISKWVIFFLR